MTWWRLYHRIFIKLWLHQKLDTDPKQFQQIEYVEQLKKTNGVNAVGDNSYLFLS